MIENNQSKKTDTAITQRPSSHERLVVIAEFPVFSPQELFDYWTQPELICQWWPQQAQIIPQRDGIYRLSWPQMGWVLNGKITECVPGELIAFTWKWEHEPQTPERHVRVTLLPPTPGGGTHLTIEHTLYTETAADQQERAGHLEGWLHFLSQLSALQP